MQITKKYLLLLLLPALLCSCGQESSAKETGSSVEEKKPLPVERIASRVADRLPRAHLNREEFDDSIATNALMMFIDSLDYDRSYFLESDIEEFKKEATLLDDEVKEGDVSFANKAFKRFKERVINRTEYVNQLLDKGFDLTIDETYQWKRDDSPWPANEEEWNELWRKKIKNEYVGRVAMREAPSDPKDKLEDDADSEELEEDDALSPEEFVRDRYKQFRLMVETNYDEETVLERYLCAFTESYDPHSTYLSPRSVEDFGIHMRLSLVGIGAMLKTSDGAAEITKIIAGGPADQDGRLGPGDKIIAVAQGDEDPVSILHWPLSRAVRLIRGKVDTKVVLTIIPAEDKTGTRTKKIALIRAKVKLEESAAKGDVYDSIETHSLPHRLGVVSLPEFYSDFEAVKKGDADARSVSIDVQKIIESFKTNDIDGVLIDLRNDGGGALNEAINITGQFIPFGPVVQVRESRGISVLPDGDPTTLYNGPLVVLVNRLSASASEILAAALQDYERAVIVGDSKTHGKGTVQTVLSLSRLTDRLGSLKVTTASFYRINGESTQLKGVIPDIILPSLLDSLEIGEEYANNALPWSQVSPAYYRTWNPSVKPYLQVLKKRSADRMLNNPAFRLFMARRERLRERMETNEISLKLSTRIDEILAEREMEDLQDSMLSGEKDDKKEDPILDETLLILSDLVSLELGEQITPPPPSSEPEAEKVQTEL